MTDQIRIYMLTIFDGLFVKMKFECSCSYVVNFVPACVESEPLFVAVHRTSMYIIVIIHNDKQDGFILKFSHARPAAD
jgi:hypothetical protein